MVKKRIHYPCLLGAYNQSIRGEMTSNSHADIKLQNVLSDMKKQC